MGLVWVRPDGVTDYAVRPAEVLDFLRESDLVVGGEQNYGFGRLRLLPEEELSRIGMHWWPEDPDAAIPVDGSRPLIGHAPYRADQLFRGDIDIVAGRQYRRNGVDGEFQGAGAEITNAGYCFVPGTRVGGGETVARLDSWGRLIWM